MRKFIEGFKVAFSGILFCFRGERNFRIQFASALLVVIAGICFGIAQWQWVAILLCCAIVLALEMINTSIEKLADAVDGKFNERIKVVKDIAAGAVLVASIFCFVIALFILLPKIFSS